MGKRSGSPQGDTKSAEVRPDGAQTELKSPDEAPKMAVDYWRDAVFPPSRRHPQHPELRLHNEAAARHGWALHQHHFGEPMRLTADD